MRPDELLQEAAFKAAPEPNLTDWLVRRAHRRYGLLGGHNADVAAAWEEGAPKCQVRERPDEEII